MKNLKTIIDKTETDLESLEVELRKMITYKGRVGTMDISEYAYRAKCSSVWMYRWLKGNLKPQHEQLISMGKNLIESYEGK